MGEDKDFYDGWTTPLLLLYIKLLELIKHCIYFGSSLKSTRFENPSSSEGFRIMDFDFLYC